MEDKNTEKYFAANQSYLFGFLVNLTLVVCIALLLYGVFGESMRGISAQPQPVPEAVQKQNRKQRAVAAVDDFDRVENGIHVQTGLVFAEGFDVVRSTCTACHSAKLVTQNRATREGWKDMIRWMQKTQGLWNLGKNEPIILDYLAKYYAPTEVVRRPGLDVAAIEWYVLELEE